MNMIKDRFQIEVKNLIYGICLLALGLLMPIIITEKTFDIYGKFSLIVDDKSITMLIDAAISLVILNSIRALPHYLGAYLIADSLRQKVESKFFIIMKCSLTFIMIYLVYIFIDFAYDIKYDFSMVAISIILVILILISKELHTVSMPKRLIDISIFLIGLQFLDLIPFLTDYKIGHGEISLDIKNLGILFGLSEFMDYFFITMTFIFLFFGIIYMIQLSKENKINLLSSMNMRAKNKIYKSHLEALELRNYREINNIAHDIKTPLTTIQGLSNLAELRSDDFKIKEYMGKISSSVDLIIDMVNELKDQDNKNMTSTENLMEGVLSYIYSNYSDIDINYRNNVKDSKVYVNRIRMTRAFINLIENSINAIEKVDGKGPIEISVFKGEDGIYFIFKDYGIGINDKMLSKIWTIGYSESESTGLGLAFIKKVIQNHDGSINIESREGEYTKATIILNDEGDVYD
ncbi:MAG: HAMP domain-containing sensor histidine kinase [Tissierellia bacterium]|nr:HAMP domain-containing sensor histidine kinase [Tissierellia bacterium]